MQEEEFALRVGDGVAPNPHSYEAIHYSRSARGSRSSKVLAAIVLGVAVGCVLLSADRYQQVAGLPARRAVSEAAALLRMGKIHEPTKSQSLQFAGVPGMLAPPPPGGYNVFDPHYSEDGVPSDHSGGTKKSVFTGHTAGTEGGPLTFGPNTYWNVFDPNGSPDLGPCDPGSTGTAGTATKKRDCTECPVGKWCPGGLDSLANDCPPHSTTFIGSSEAEQCTCSLGWFGVAHYHETSSCKMCLADTYCPGGRTQDACPLHSSSPDEASYCSCDSSYYGITHDDCKLCEKDFFCPGGDPRGQQQFACPMNSNSAAGSDNGNDCQCNARYYEPLPDTDTEGPDCVLCPANTYCLGGPNKADCPANAASPAGSDDKTECVCNAGYYGINGQSCTKCPDGEYCPGGNRHPVCPANSWDNGGSSDTKIADCLCNAGYVGSDPSNCQVCPEGSYCTGQGVISQCPANSHAPAGSSDYTCNDGYVRKSDGSCFMCPPDFYCPPGDNYLPTACPKNTEAPPMSTSPHDCKCLAGYQNNAYAASNNWFKVRQGSYAQVREACQAGGGELASINTILEMEAAGAICDECWIGLKRTSADGPWQWEDGHEIDFTMWALGKPDAQLRAAFKKSGTSWYWDDYFANNRLEGVCKKTSVAPACVQVFSPFSEGMSTGFITDFFYVGKSLSSLPNNLIQTGVPNFEGKVDGIPFENDKSFKTIDSNAPHDRLAGTWTGMLEIFLPGTYVFTTKSDDGSHLYVDGTIVVDNGGLHGARLRDGDVKLVTGYHMIKADWFENGGDASMVARYKGPDTQNIFREMAVTHFKRTTASLPDPASLGMRRGWMLRLWKFDKGLKSFPASECKDDNVYKMAVVPEVMYDDNSWKNELGMTDRFAAVFTGILAVYKPGFYDFWTESDDGSHLSVDGVPVVSNGGLHGPVKKRGSMRLNHGFHFVTVRFFENGGGAVLKLSYKGPDTGGKEWPIDAFLPPNAPGAPPPP